MRKGNRGKGKVLDFGSEALKAAAVSRRQVERAAKLEAARARIAVACERYPDPEALKEAAELRVRHLASTTRLSLWQAFAKVERELRGVEDEN